MVVVPAASHTHPVAAGAVCEAHAVKTTRVGSESSSRISPG